MDRKSSIPNARRALLALAVCIPLVLPSLGHAQGGAMAGAPTFIEFALGRADLSPDARQQIAGLAKEITDSQAQGKPLIATLSGRTDGSGAAAGNRRLKTRREQAVLREFLRLGVPASSVKIYSGQTDYPGDAAETAPDPSKRTVTISLAPAS